MWVVILEMGVEIVSLVFNDSFDVRLFGVVELHFLDAIVGA
jgi:hypothetical protein